MSHEKKKAYERLGLSVKQCNVLFTEDDDCGTCGSRDIVVVVRFADLKLPNPRGLWDGMCADCVDSLGGTLSPWG
jgi:hypothetical protein